MEDSVYNIPPYTENDSDCGSFYLKNIESDPELIYITNDNDTFTTIFKRVNKEFPALTLAKELSPNSLSERWMDSTRAYLKRGIRSKFHEGYVVSIAMLPRRQAIHGAASGQDLRPPQEQEEPEEQLEDQEESPENLGVARVRRSSRPTPKRDLFQAGPYLEGGSMKKVANT